MDKNENNVMLDDAEVSESISEISPALNDISEDVEISAGDADAEEIRVDLYEYEESDGEEVSNDNISEDEEDDDESENDVKDKEVSVKPIPKRRRRRGHGHIIFGIALSVVIISVSVFSAVFILKCSKELLAIDKSDIEIVVDIPMDSSTADIAEILHSEGIIDDVTLFRAFSRFKGTDGTYIAGTHKLSPKMDYNTIIKTLQEDAENKRETADIVFQEGITLYAAAKKLEEKGVCSADEFVKVFNSSKFGFDFEEKVKVSGMKFCKMEGYLFPDTYQFYLDDDPRVVAKKIYKNFDARVTPDLYGRMNDLGMELEEVLTLASIVQAEAANTRDMKNVASVFYNRLGAPDEYPLLQSDPTTNYVEDVIMPNIEIKSEKIFEAYDTYRGAGLPPGPICNPGLDAINAVLYPAETDYFYFCSNIETGEFFYAETLDEHERNLVEAGLVQ